MENKQRSLFLILAGIFLTNALIAEFIGAKLIAFTLFGIPFVQTAGVIVWPVVFLTTDLINEYFGIKGVRRISFSTAAFIGYAFGIVYVAIGLPPSPDWLQMNQVDDVGRPFNIEFAFDIIFGQGLNIIIGSLVAFLLGQLVDVFIFDFIRKKTGGRMLWLRSTGSTLISQAFDSFVVLFLAFYLLKPEASRLSLDLVMQISVSNYVYKIIVAIALTPLVYLGHFLIDRYLGKETSKAMQENSTRGLSD